MTREWRVSYDTRIGTIAGHDPQWRRTHTRSGAIPTEDYAHTYANALRADRKNYRNIVVEYRTVSEWTEQAALPFDHDAEHTVVDVCVGEGLL